MKHIVKVENLWSCGDEVDEETKYYGFYSIEDALKCAAEKVELAKEFSNFAWIVSLRAGLDWVELYSTDNWCEELQDKAFFLEG